MQAGRRDVLRWSGLALVAVPLAACDGGYDDTPDPLSALVKAARADAAAAGKLGDGVAKQIAALRSSQAEVIAREVERANRPASAAPRDQAPKDLKALGKRLTAAGTRAAELLPEASRPRAGLLASVAAGCAGALVLDPKLGKPRTPRFTEPRLTGELEQDGLDALQQALAAEHAALWILGQISAFLAAGYDDGLRDAGTEHRERRDATQQVLTAAGATPVLAETAYLTPKPVKNAGSARAAVVVAETDAAAAWRGVVERCDEPALRTFATAAMSASAVRMTRWRREAGTDPAAVALPGAPEA